MLNWIHDKLDPSEEETSEPEVTAIKNTQNEAFRRKKKRKSTSPLTGTISSSLRYRYIAI